MRLAVTKAIVGRIAVSVSVRNSCRGATQPMDRTQQTMNMCAASTIRLVINVGNVPDHACFNSNDDVYKTK